MISGDLNDKPVTVDSQTFHKRTIRYDPSHDVFIGFGHQPVEAVLMEVSSTVLSRMDEPGDWTQSRLYAELKAKYCADQRITPESLAARSTDTLKDIRNCIASEEFELDGFEIPSSIKEETERNLFKKKRDTSTSLEDILETSAYLKFAPNQELIRYFEAHPDQFFDGVVWDRAYDSIDSAELQKQSKDEFTGYLKDARMLAEDALEMDIENSHPSNRMELERAAMSLRILESEAV